MVQTKGYYRASRGGYYSSMGIAVKSTLVTMHPAGNFIHILNSFLQDKSRPIRLGVVTPTE